VWYLFKVAPYPFTTLNPHQGVVEFADFFRFTVADIPGLIVGAHENRGLRHQFLRHIERSKIIAYVIDIRSHQFLFCLFVSLFLTCAPSLDFFFTLPPPPLISHLPVLYCLQCGRGAGAEDPKALQRELELYLPGLSSRSSAWSAANKCDLPGAAVARETAAGCYAAARHCGPSRPSGHLAGISDATRALRRLVTT
jgi:GTPase involved in cell partitioning and DNA repair